MYTISKQSLTVTDTESGTTKHIQLTAYQCTHNRYTLGASNPVEVLVERADESLSLNGPKFDRFIIAGG